MSALMENHSGSLGAMSAAHAVSTTPERRLVPAQSGSGVHSASVYTEADRGRRIEHTCGIFVIVGEGGVFVDGETHGPHYCAEPRAAGGSGRQREETQNRDYGEHARRVRLTSAAAIRPRPVQWTWADRLPTGELALTPGRGGVGKSTFHAWITAGVTRGTLPGAHYGVPSAVIIAAAEDSWSRTIVPRLIAAGADLNLVYRADVISEAGAEITVTLPVDCDALETEIARVGAKLMSIDPLMSTLSGSLDTHKDRDVRQALEPLARLADRTGCTILGNAHFNKSTGGDPLSMIMGSAAFGNVVRAALGFAVDPDSEDGSCVISQVKNNLGRLDLPSLRYGIETAIIDTDEGPAEVGKLVMLGVSNRSVGDILGEHGGGDARNASKDAVDILRTVLSWGPVAANDVLDQARAAGISKSTLDRAKMKIGAKSKKLGDRWWWSLPDDRHAPQEPRTGLVDDHDDLDHDSALPTCRICASAPADDGERSGLPVCLDCGARWDRGEVLPPAEWPDAETVLT